MRSRRSSNPETFLPPAPAWSGASEKLIAAGKDAWITPSEKDRADGDAHL
jgi:hypothetical protein